MIVWLFMDNKIMLLYTLFSIFIVNNNFQYVGINWFSWTTMKTTHVPSLMVIKSWNISVNKVVILTYTNILIVWTWLYELIVPCLLSMSYERTLNRKNHHPHKHVNDINNRLELAWKWPCEVVEKNTTLIFFNPQMIFAFYFSSMRLMYLPLLVDIFVVFLFHLYSGKTITRDTDA